MATLRIKRGQSASIEDLSLQEGELAVTLDTGKLYVGIADGQKKLVNEDHAASESANKLTTPRNFSVTGDATAEAVAFDGTGDVALNLTLATVASGGTGTKVTYNNKGLITSSAPLEVADLPNGIGADKLTGVIPSTEKGAASGVATLGEDSKVPAAQIPDLSATYVSVNKLGASDGVAQLDSSGKVPAAQLPSYVDDVVEGYLKVEEGKFYKTKSEENEYSEEITGESGKIYLDVDTNKQYRWGGSQFVEISKSLALGETSSTAFAGDKGKTAYDHSQITEGNPHGTTASDIGAAEASHTSVNASDSVLGHVKLGTGFTAPDGVLTLTEIDCGTF